MLLSELYMEGLKNTPDKPVLIVDDTKCSYRELHEVSEKWAQALLHFGIRRGDRVTIMMENRIEYLQLYFACYRIGAVASPMSCVTQTLADEVTFAVNLTGSRLLIVSGKYCDAVRDIRKNAPSIERIFVIDDTPDGELSWKGFVQSAPGDIPWPEVKETDPALILFTSGSTDRPKGVTHTHSSITNCVINKSTTLGFNSQDINLVATYLCHASGSFGFSLPFIYKGGTVVVMGSYSASGFLDFIEKYRPTYTVTVPNEAREIISHPRAKQVDFSSIKTFKCGGDAVPHDLQEEFLRIAGFEILQGFGSTECEEFCANRPDRHRFGSIGVPMNGVQMRVIDHEGRDLPQGEAGELIVLCKGTMAGYWNDPVNTEKAFIDGWFRTGDLVWQDEDGFYFFAGRIKNIIVKCGGNITPAEVEDAIDEHPGVRVCGVTGAPDKECGQIVHAFVVTEKSPDRPEPTEQELREFVGKKLSSFKVPDRWTFLESLPLNANGKIDRRALEKLAKEHALQSQSA